MYVQKRIVPWSSLYEYQRVASLIQSNDLHNLNEAVQIMLIWFCRVNVSKVPRAILCTYELLVAKVEESTTGLAMAVMRFISLVSSEDQDRVRNQCAVPVSSLAKKAGLPEWMSDLRNDIAHGSLPSQAFLNDAYIWAISWLSEFWQRNREDPAIERTVGHLNFGNVDWNCPQISALEEEMGVALRSHIIVRSFVTFMVGFVKKSSCSQQSINRFRPILSMFQKKKKINEVVLSTIYLLPHFEGAHFWTKTWFESFASVKSRTPHPLSEFVEPDEILNFPWKNALDHLSTVLNAKTAPLMKLLVELYSPKLPADKCKFLLSLCGIGKVIVRSRSRPSCKWNLEKSVRWWRLPLGTCLKMNHASSSRWNQGFSNKDPQGRRKICEDKDK